MKRVSKYSGITGLVIALCMVIGIFITSLNIICFSGTGWFRHEYEKYSVLEDVRGEMSMESALEVTDEMIDYLKGRRDNLAVYTTVDGSSREFFSEKEKTHLEDCRRIFAAASKLGLWCYAVAVVLLVIGYIRREKGLALSFACWTTLIAAAAAVGFLSAGFERLFTGMHLSIFDNQLWLLNPSEDNLINLLPLGFFSDTATMIAALSVAIEAVIILVLFTVEKKRNE